MAAKKKSTNKKTPKTIVLINLNEAIRDAILKACQGDTWPKPTTIKALATIGYTVVAKWSPTVLTIDACVQEARGLIAAGIIVKAGGVYTRAHIGSGNEEGVQAHTFDARSTKLPESVEQAFGVVRR